MKMTRILFTTLSLLLLLLAAPLEAYEGHAKLPSNFHSLFPFLGRTNDLNLPRYLPQDAPQEQLPPQEAVPAHHKLSEGFYNLSCPNAEKIVSDEFTNIVKNNPGAIGNIFRLFFHDCFVNGCDASILLDYAPSGDNVEKSSMMNGPLLKGADMIDEIKEKIEEECPETVSCADILAFATNEAMRLGGLPPRRPLGGRRDGLVSIASIAEANNLPKPDWTMDQMIELFERKGYSIEEMVVLIGAHSVGSTHCDFFIQRINDFRKTGKPDPTLTVEVLQELRNACPKYGTNQYRNPPVNFDATPTVLDNLFFKDMVDRRKTLLITDSHLLEDNRTFPFVQKMASDPNLFPTRFSDVMLKLSSLNVLTGHDGEVRKICRSTN